MEEASINHQPIITLLTDFGNENGFVGVMKGVILQIAPSARIVDIAHDLPPFSIPAASFLNHWSYGYFPVGTIHLCVVDPGVGTRRRILIAELDGHRFVAPDNGLLTPILERPNVSIVHATNKRYWLDNISNTFHGRDIFSPIAAHLANGVPISSMGGSIHDHLRLYVPSPRIHRDIIDCHVCYIDRFGNLITDLDRTVFLEWCHQNGCGEKEIVILFQDHCIVGLSRSYGEKSHGELLAVFDGYNRLEIAISGGNAAITTGLGFEAPIKICTSWAV